MYIIQLNILNKIWTTKSELVTIYIILWNQKYIYFWNYHAAFLSLATIRQQWQCNIQHVSMQTKITGQRNDFVKQRVRSTFCFGVHTERTAGHRHCTARYIKYETSRRFYIINSLRVEEGVPLFFYILYTSLCDIIFIGTLFRKMSCKVYTLCYIYFLKLLKIFKYI